MKKLTNIRHGDLALIGISKLPKCLKKTPTNVLMKGNNGHDHTFDKGIVYIVENSDTVQENNFIFGYFVASDTILSHEDHGDTIVGNTRQASIPNGIYELRKQKEYTPEGLKVVID